MDTELIAQAANQEGLCGLIWSGSGVWGLGDEKTTII